MEMIAEHLQGPATKTLAESKPTELGPSERNSEKTPMLEPKLFFWDNIIFYLASAILGLSVSNIIVDFLRPEPNAVACFSSFNSRDQAAYVNNYCNDFLPFAENFTLALVIHGVLLLLPHYLWKVYFSARMDFFFTHAAKLETLRDRNTGEYPHKNFNVVDYMHREFQERKDILIGYVLKLILQFIIALVAIATTAGLFQDFAIKFYCSDADDEDPVFHQVKCSYAKLRFVSLLRWADYIFLGLSVGTIGYGLYWCLLKNHPELGHQETSQFCYDSCINSKHCETKKRWYHLDLLLLLNLTKAKRKRYRLENDLHFLLVSLFSTNTGLGRVFKSVQVANDISQELNAHLESLDNYDSMKHPQREADMHGNSAKIFKEGSFPKIIFEICKGIYHEQDKTMDASRMGAMDIGCGYHSSLFAIARWQKQVISIILDPYYKNQTKIFKCDEYHAGVILMRIPTNLFGLPKQHKLDFSDKIQLYSGLKEPPDVVQLVIKFSLVVVGPLDSDRKSNTVNQIIEMHSRSPYYFEEGSIMLIFRPLEVEGRKVTDFVDWKPESTEYWKETSSLENLNNWLPDNDSVISVDEASKDGKDGTITVQCGNLQCTFGVKTYRYAGHGHRQKHEAAAYTTV